MHCGAIRKVLLAWQTPTFIDEYFRTIIIHDQAFPHVRPDDLREELKKIRQDGYAITRGEYVNDAVGIGAPVFNSEGELAGSIGIIAPEIRIDERTLSQAVRYNSVLRARFVILTNGRKHYCCEYRGGRYVQLAGFPDFAAL